MPKMAAASILLDIHCYLQVDQELAVDMHTQPVTQYPDKMTTVTFFHYAVQKRFVPLEIFYKNMGQ